jgi:tetratricopeptide (TPR) repeat protein
VESVAWVSELKGLMCTFFYILAFMAYIRFSRIGKKSFYIISLLLFLLSLLSKPMSVTFPVILILFDYYEEKLTKSKLIEKLPFFVLSFALSIVIFMAQKSWYAVSSDKLYLFPFSNIAFYISKLTLPIKLSAHYEYPLIFGYLSKETFMSILVILGVVIYLINFKKIKRIVNFGILFFLVSLLPILRFVPVGLSCAADRYMYIPMIGAFLAIAMLIDSFAHNKQKVKKALIVVTGVYVLFLANLSFSRCDVWKDSYSLWSDIVVKYPDSSYARLYYNQTLAELGISHLNNKEFAKARKYYSTILEYYLNSQKYSSTYEEAKGEFFSYNDGNKKIAYKRVVVDFINIELKEEALYNMGRAYLYENNLKESKKYFTLLIEQFPGNADGYMLLGSISVLQNDYKKAIELYKKSVRLDPKNHRIHYNFAVTLEGDGNLKEAIKHYKLASKLKAGWELPKEALARLTGSNVK